MDEIEVDADGAAGSVPAADVRHDPPLPRPRVRAPDAAPGARGPGAAPAQRPATSTARGSSGTSAARARAEEAPTAGCARSTGPTLRRIASRVGPDRDPVQAYCDVLEHKWLLSEQAGRDVGLATAIESYLAEGAPAPERTDPDTESVLDTLDVEADDLDWAGGGTS